MEERSIHSSEVIELQDSVILHLKVDPGKMVRVGLWINLKDSSKSIQLVIKAEAPHTQAHIRVVSILNNSHLTLDGLVRVEKGAKHSQLHFNHKTILLDATSTVVSQPQLEILEDEVKCGHGATVSEIEQNQIEYLVSRGMTRQNAKNMLCLSQKQALCEWVLMK